MPPAPSQWPLAPRSLLSANDKSDNEIKPKTMNKSPDISLWLRKFLENRLMEVVTSQHLKRGPLPQMTWMNHSADQKGRMEMRRKGLIDKNCFMKKYVVARWFCSTFTGETQDNHPKRLIVHLPNMHEDWICLFVNHRIAIPRGYSRLTEVAKAVTGKPGTYL